MSPGVCCDFFGGARVLLRHDPGLAVPYPRSQPSRVGRSGFGLDGTTISPPGVGGRLTLFRAERGTRVAVDTKTKSGSPNGFARMMPIFHRLPNYNMSWLKADLIAGLSVWALIVPTSLGYATISGVPVQYGLYAAAASLIGFAVLAQRALSMAASTLAATRLVTTWPSWPSWWASSSWSS